MSPAQQSSCNDSNSATDNMTEKHGIPAGCRCRRDLWFSFPSLGSSSISLASGSVTGCCDDANVNACTSQWPSLLISPMGDFGIVVRVTRQLHGERSKKTKQPSRRDRHNNDYHCYVKCLRTLQKLIDHLSSSSSLP